MTYRRRRKSSGYDKDLDKKIWSEQVHPGRDAIEVAIKCYDGGVNKLVLERPEVEYGRLGRLTAEEVAAVLPLMLRGLDKLRELEGVTPPQADDDDDDDDDEEPAVVTEEAAEEEEAKSQVQQMPPPKIGHWR